MVIFPISVITNRPLLGGTRSAAHFAAPRSIGPPAAAAAGSATYAAALPAENLKPKQ